MSLHEEEAEGEEEYGVSFNEPALADTVPLTEIEEYEVKTGVLHEEEVGEEEYAFSFAERTLGQNIPLHIIEEYAGEGGVTMYPMEEEEAVVVEEEEEEEEEEEAVVEEEEVGEEEQGFAQSVPLTKNEEYEGEAKPPSIISSKSPSTGTISAIMKSGDVEGHLTPFRLQWSFGVGLHVPVLNLSNIRSSLVAYAATHVGIVYDCTTKQMRLLPGHKNMISTLATDSTGQWLVSADQGPDNTVIVWDTTECIPVYTIFDPHPDHGTAVVGLSGNAKYLITIGYEEKPILKFWLWTYGKEQCDDSFEFDLASQVVVKVSFNPNVQEHIMVVFPHKVYFFEWDPENNKLLPPVISTIKNAKLYGRITDCTYCDSCHECVASTDLGYLLIFGSTVYTCPFDESELSNNKSFGNAIKVSSVRINCLESADGMIAAGDEKGEIKFFDKTRKILYWCQSFQLPPVTYISFNRHKRHYKLKDALDFDDESVDTIPCYMENCQCADNYEEYERLYAQLVPSDATLQRYPFIIRDFIIATADGTIAQIDYIRSKCNFLFRKSAAAVAAIDVHAEEPYIAIAYTNGVISLYNYESREQIVEVVLPQEYDDYEERYIEITTLKYSPQSLHLACGKDNGRVIFLDPIMLTPKNSGFNLSRGRIVKIVFSSDSRYVAYYNNSATIFLMRFLSKENDWEIMGKLRSHYKPIHDILFTPYLPSRFFSIGADRYLVEYDLEKSCYGIIELICRERIEQSATPMAFTYRRSISTAADRYLLIADDQYKYKYVHDKTFMCRSVTLAPSYECYKDSPVKKMTTLRRHNDRYLIFANHNQIGIQASPPDGNPYKYVGTTGHPRRLKDFCTCFEGKYVFTIGEEDNCVLMWEINTTSVEVMSRIGGVELDPYYCLIEGGINGWLFKEMQDLFYYMQILHQGENTVVPRIVNDKIPVSELPDLMRACGFYPTEYEIENIIIDVKYRDYDRSKTLKEEVDFFEFVRLYINHRPAHGITTTILAEAFDSFSMGNNMSNAAFVDALCERGEMFSRSKAHTCLSTLMHAVDDDAEEDYDFSFLPEDIDFNTFLEEILGMDMERQGLAEEQKNTDSLSEDNQIC